MKKLPYIFALLAFISFENIYAQNCTPGNQTVAGLYPDSVTNLPCAVVDSLYFTTMTVVVPVDTQLFPPPAPAAPVDSAVLVSLTGLPSGYGFLCEPASCSWAGGTSGCIKITGISSIQGVYSLIAVVESYLLGLTDPQSTDSVTYYTINVTTPANCEPVSINEQAELELVLIQNIPNPFSERTVIQYIVPNPSDIDFIVYNMLGESIFSNRFRATGGMNKIEFEAKGLAPGIYIYSLKNGKGAVTGKMIISKR